MIKAWDIGVATMRVGEVSQLVCKPEYAYGAAGSPPKIPPNATLVFEVRASQDTRSMIDSLLQPIGIIQRSDDVEEISCLAMNVFIAR